MRLDSKRSMAQRVTPIQADHIARTMRRLLLTAGLLVISSHWVATSSLGAGAHSDSTISSPGTASGDSKRSAGGPDLSSTASLASLLEDNYLESPGSTNQTGEASAHQVQTSDEISDNSLTSFKLMVAKSRKQAENQIREADWWSRLAGSRNTKSRSQSETKGSRAASKPAPPSVYKEQPLSQNSILTIRNQLLAVRDKHRLLMTRSVPQLMRLDQKLVDSYKLCLKRKMPLYAGMLYRTRDFVVRMANEVKHERQMLEALVKQQQRLLRHKITNRTLVKEYNRLASITTPVPAGAPTGSQRQNAGSNDDATVDYSGSKSKRSAAVEPLDGFIARDVASSPAATVAGSLTELQPRGNKKDGLRSISDEPNSFDTRRRQQQQHNQSANSASDGSLSPASSLRITGTADKIATATSTEANSQQRDMAKKLPTNGNNSPLARRQAPSHAAEIQVSDGSSNAQLQQQQQQLDHGLGNSFDDHTRQAIPIGPATISPAQVSTQSIGTRKPRQQTYSVHVNEVNLKRELVKMQTLIDRINSSSIELTRVVDDIVYLFKLTSAESRKGLSYSGKTSKFEKLHGKSMLMDIANNGVDQKRARKLLKSPLKVLFERYGKMTVQSSANSIDAGSTSALSDLTVAAMRTTSSSETSLATSGLVDVDTDNLPEMKPLFDSASFGTYAEPFDPELGFDVPTVIEI